jgi:hypothetical protein
VAGVPFENHGNPLLVKDIAIYLTDVVVSLELKTNFLYPPEHRC